MKISIGVIPAKERHPGETGAGSSLKATLDSGFRRNDVDDGFRNAFIRPNEKGMYKLLALLRLSLASLAAVVENPCERIRAVGSHPQLSLRRRPVANWRLRPYGCMKFVFTGDA